VLFTHQSLRFFNAAFAFLGGDRHDVVSHATQTSDRFGLRALLRLTRFIVRMDQRLAEQRSAGHTCGQTEKVSAIGTHCSGASLVFCAKCVVLLICTWLRGLIANAT
jgi:hypothetical protein